MNFLFQKNHLRQFIIFLFGGGLGAVINLAATYLLTELFGFWYLSSYGIGVLANISFNFFFHRAITFKEKSDTKKRIAKFFLVSAFIGLGIIFFAYLFTDVLGIWYIISGILAIAIMSTINFFINKLWVFSSYAKD